MAVHPARVPAVKAAIHGPLPSWQQAFQQVAWGQANKQPAPSGYRGVLLPNKAGVQNYNFGANAQQTPQGLVAGPGPQPGTNPASSPAQPFLTPEQQLDSINNEQQRGIQNAALEGAWDNARINDEYARGQLEQTARQQVAQANDSAAARGLFNSSIRAGDLYDIDAASAIKRRYLDDTLNAQRTAHDTGLSNLNTWWTNYQQGLNRLKVENAQAVNPAPSQMDLSKITPDGWKYIIAATGGIKR